MDNPQSTQEESTEVAHFPGWERILAINQYARNNPRPSKSLTVVSEQGQWQFYPDIDPRDLTSRGITISFDNELPEDMNQLFQIYGWQRGFSVEPLTIGATAAERTGTFQHYLGYALLPWQAEAEKRCITVTHFAQSLDGKIATHTGHSRWIGNDENLLHAHKMRALCEGILIGKGTLVSDDPALTTRHVEGPNPRRIVVSSTPCNFESLLNSSKEEIWWVGGKEDSEYVRCIQIEKHPAKTRCERLLQALYEKGINTLFIEGGSVTTSAFLSEGMIDIMQFHISPMVFGSGIPGINLPEIAEVGESVKFDSWKFVPVGDAVMFVGKPEKNES